MKRLFGSKHDGGKCQRQGDLSHPTIQTNMIIRVASYVMIPSTRG
jgi:hypothetical protein